MNIPGQLRRSLNSTIRSRQRDARTPRPLLVKSTRCIPVSRSGSHQWLPMRVHASVRAHQLDMIRDWVVIYRDDQDGSGQWTVVTSQFGPLRGKRIVRGRETLSALETMLREAFRGGKADVIIHCAGAVGGLFRTEGGSEMLMRERRMGRRFPLHQAHRNRVHRGWAFTAHPGTSALALEPFVPTPFPRSAPLLVDCDFCRGA